MATSFSAAERSNPPSRQKACTACMKAKRRCDFAAPSCLRCSSRCIPCEYPPRHARAAYRQKQSQSRSSPQEDALPAANIVPDLPLELDLHLDFNSLPTPISITTPGCDDSYGVSTDGGVNPLFTQYVDPYKRRFPDGLAVECTGDAIQQLEMSNSLLPPMSRDLKYMANLIAKNLQFAIDTFMKVPRSMVEELRAPWCHHQLYKDEAPRCIRDVQAACALYLAKNEVNSLVIMRSIESYCQDLLSAPLPTTPCETLAHTHALLLYQIIRLFDGDLAARASADQAIPKLESYALSLLGHVHFEDPLFPAPDLPLDPIGPTKIFWKQWLFQESARRTMLFVFFFLQIYRMVSGGMLIQCDGRMGLVHSWTLSAHLWQAKTPVEFAKAWRDRNHFVVTNAQFRQVINEAKADDVDAFGRILLSAMMGNDEADGWLAQRGGSLREEICF